MKGMNMKENKIDFYEEHAVYTHGSKTYKFETYLRRSKTHVFELVMVIPEKIKELRTGFEASKEESREIIQGMKEHLSSSFQQNVSFEYKNAMRIGLMEKISDLFSNYRAPKDKGVNTHNKRAFRGFELQEDNCTAIDKERDIEVSLKVGLSGSSLTYKKGDYILTMQAGADILGEVLYSNTIYLEKPFRWDEPNEATQISIEEIETIKTDIRNAMELFDSLVFFKEIERKSEGERVAFVKNQLELINKRKKAGNEI